MKDAIGITRESCENDFVWEAEYVTSLVGRGEGRNHDMAIWGKDIFIGVEAKADEPFGKEVKLWLSEGDSNKENRIKRLNDLCNIAFGKEYDCSKHADVMYQLLSAFAGTVREAVKDGKSKAMLLVLVFESDITGDVLMSKNDKDLVEFANKASMKNITPEVGKTKLNCAYSKHISGISTVIDGKKHPINIDAYIVKATISISPCDECNRYDTCKSKAKSKEKK
ncbi:MAG: hypothetical protein J6X34_06845 [Clostridia bacterium]|nr:hypothetical protein [Clostridia bacterium]